LLKRREKPGAWWQAQAPGIGARAGNYDFTLSYLTAHAGWVPSYDLKVESVSKPLKLIQKARIIQTTGFDWSQVKLNLSTSYPSQHGDAPIFKTWFLAYIDPMQRLRNANVLTQHDPRDGGK
jgi:hypothetical protein